MVEDWITAAGWTPSQVEIEFVHRDGQHALVVFRTRSEPRHRELAVLSLDSTHLPGQWTPVAEGTDIRVTAGQAGWTPVCVYAYGRSDARVEVTCSYQAREHRIETDRDGWWALLLDTDPAAADLVAPSVVSFGWDC